MCAVHFSGIVKEGTQRHQSLVSCVGTATTDILQPSQELQNETVIYAGKADLSNWNLLLLAHPGHEQIQSLFVGQDRVGA